MHVITVSLKKSLFFLVVLLTYFSGLAYGDETEEPLPDDKKKPAATSSAGLHNHYFNTTEQGETNTGKALRKSALKSPIVAHYELCNIENDEYKLLKFVDTPANRCDSGINAEIDGKPREACFVQMTYSAIQGVGIVHCPHDFIEVMSFGITLKNENSNRFVSYYNEDTQTDIPSIDAMQFYHRDNSYDCRTNANFSVPYSIEQAIKGSWPTRFGGADSLGMLATKSGRNCDWRGLNCFPRKPSPYFLEPYTDNPQTTFPRSTPVVSGQTVITAQGRLIQVSRIDREDRCWHPGRSSFVSVNDCGESPPGNTPEGGYWVSIFKYTGPQIVCTRKAGYFPVPNNPHNYRFASLGTTPYLNTTKICAKKLKGYNLYHQKGHFLGTSCIEAKCANNTLPGTTRECKDPDLNAPN